VKTACMRAGVQIPRGFIRTCNNEVSHVTSSVIAGCDCTCTVQVFVVMDSQTDAS